MPLRSQFGYHTTPFTREIEPKDHFTLPMHQQALEGLEHALDRRMSAALIAPAGTGKTTIVRKLLSHLPEARYDVHYVKVTGLSKRDMCREIATACSVVPAGSYPTLILRLQERFESTTGDGRRPVIVLDEAQDLRPDVLDMMRILTNFHMDSRLILSILLCGQPALAKMLARDDQEATARRIGHYATLRPLSRDETLAYLEHRSTLAGARALPFDTSAIDALFEFSRGNLRALDGLALESLEIAARAKLSAASAGHVAQARKVLWP
jgi:general secretion pathway protein A